MSKQEYIGGRNPVLEAMRAGRRLHKLYIAEGAKGRGIQPILAMAKEHNAVVQYVPRQHLDRLFAGEHQGVVAVAEAYATLELDELLDQVREKPDPFFVLLEGVQDPHNLGSILRTADAVGVDGIILPKRRAAGITPAVVKASTGAIEYVPVARVTNVARSLEQLKEKGFWIVGAEASAKRRFDQVDYHMPVVLVLGSEGWGISRLVREKLDFEVSLPMTGHVNSLNVSVAAGILMYEVFRQRWEGEKVRE